MSESEPWNRTDRSRRKNATLKERKRYLIITEGSTEALYLKHFKTSTDLEVIVENPRVNKQLSLVQRAIKIRDDQIATRGFLAGHDEIWVVCDRDIDPKNPKDKNNFNAALALAKREGLSVALSNDSFELWYLLHFQDVSSSMHRRVLDEKLSQHLGRTYKSRHRSKVEDLYYEVKDSRQKALKRAKKLYESCIEDGLAWESRNPLTLVHVLVEQIMQEKGFREE